MVAFVLILVHLAAALKKFGEERHPSAVAICDLAQYNYIEVVFP